MNFKTTIRNFKKNNKPVIAYHSTLEQARAWAKTMVEVYPDEDIDITEAKEELKETVRHDGGDKKSQ